MSTFRLSRGLGDFSLTPAGEVGPGPDPDPGQDLEFIAGVSGNAAGYVFHDLGTLISNFEDTPALICLNSVDPPHTQKIGFTGIGFLPQLLSARFTVPGIGELLASDANLYTEANYFEFQWSVGNNPFQDGETYIVRMVLEQAFMPFAVNLSGDQMPDVEGLSGEIGYIALSGDART